MVGGEYFVSYIANIFLHFFAKKGRYGRAGIKRLFGVFIYQRAYKCLIAISLQKRIGLISK